MFKAELLFGCQQKVVVQPVGPPCSLGLAQFWQVLWFVVKICEEIPAVKPHDITEQTTMTADPHPHEQLQ